ncbi:MAG: indole-3-glycerol-phosphate synthase [Chloroflexi bacterium]|nr:indole-3-glycerol-phosphate synthase [Chloroflexota bacterium]
MISHGKYTGTVLDEIITSKREVLLESERGVPLAEMRRAAEESGGRTDYLAALSSPGMSVITEMKRASASAGTLAPELDPQAMAKTFIDGGASAISVLTEASRFSGSIDDLRAVKSVAGPRNVPVMEKDFVFSDYQVYEAAANGADAVLLIIAILEPEQYAELLSLSLGLGLGVLVEVFTEDELDIALVQNPQIVGINNRNLKTLTTDIALFESLGPKVPKDKILVAESGMKGVEDVRRMEAAGANAVLIGESLMQAGGSVSDLVTSLSS